MPHPALPRDPVLRVVWLVVAYAVTRFLVLVATRARELYPYQDDPLEMSVFAGWGAAFADGAPGVPLRDGPWEYPAGAAAVIVAPALLRGAPYVLGFVGHMALWDLALLLVLVVVGLRRGSLAGAWLWVAVVPLLGPVALARFDVVPTALAVGGLAAGGGAPLLAGVLLGSGAVIKLWPALLVPLVLLLQRGRAKVLAGSVAVGVLVLGAVAAYGGLGQLLSFLSYQRDRGLQTESLPALPLMTARAQGDQRMTTGFAFGATEVYGPWSPTMLRIGSVGIVLVLITVAALALRARRRRADPELAVVTLSVLLMSGILVFDKVLSAQYPLWLAGLVCLALCRPGSPLRVVVAPVLGVLVLTQLLYPLSIQTLVNTPDRYPVLLLQARAVLLVVVVALAAQACWLLGSEQRVGADEHRGEDAHADRAAEEHRVMGPIALGQPGEGPHRGEQHEVDAGHRQQGPAGPHEEQREQRADPDVDGVRGPGA
jgi:hypothetical protein